MNDGADAKRFNLDLLEVDIEQLLEKGLDFIILDYPFGYRHNKIAKHIDISIFIDTPLDIALGRRLLRDYKGVSDKNVFEDIEFYLSRGRKTYLSSRNLAIDDADIIVDGSEPINWIIDFIKSKFHESITE